MAATICPVRSEGEVISKQLVTLQGEVVSKQLVTLQGEVVSKQLVVLQLVWRKEEGSKKKL